MAKRGRPPKYVEWLEPDKLILIEGWARDGLTDEQIAHNMGIRRETLIEWKKDFPLISNTLKNSKEVVDRMVENALFNKAKAGDITAQIFWLKNRKPNQWRDKRDIELKADMDLSKVADDRLKEIERLLNETNTSKPE